jgi:hypothetical protein
MSVQLQVLAAEQTNDDYKEGTQDGLLADFTISACVAW